jgi:hypothetical protein
MSTFNETSASWLCVLARGIVQTARLAAENEASGDSPTARLACVSVSLEAAEAMLLELCERIDKLEPLPKA